MNQTLKDKQTVHTETSGLECRVEKYLGGGGQGEVYQADLGGKKVALKWYFTGSATPEQRKALEDLVKMGAPTKRFLWPLELSSSPGVPGFGYIMELRDSRYKGIVDMMKRRIDPSFRSVATAGFELADSYLQLHSKGLCYRDISFGNVMFDPDSGEVLICDNDNVAVDVKALSGVLGTPRFMAPEVVRGDALPSTQTDLYSLSVLLFCLLVMHHPLDGKKESAIKCMDLPAMTKLYGTEPLFIFDPLDKSNEPTAENHQNALAFWPIYPKSLRNLFTKAFTEGLQDPQNGRVAESKWRAEMIKLRDSIIYCSFCNNENFYDSEALATSGGKPGNCWSCGKDIHLPFRIRIGRNIVMLNHDTQLYPHHLDDNRIYDFSQPAATVTRHPTNPSIWGLKNLSNEKWSLTTEQGTINDIEPGRSLTLAKGTKVNFGRTGGEITI